MKHIKTAKYKRGSCFPSVNDLRKKQKRLKQSRRDFHQISSSLHEELQFVKGLALQTCEHKCPELDKKQMHRMQKGVNDRISKLDNKLKHVKKRFASINESLKRLEKEVAEMTRQVKDTHESAINIAVKTSFMNNFQLEQHSNDYSLTSPFCSAKGAPKKTTEHKGAKRGRKPEALKVEALRGGCKQGHEFEEWGENVAF